MNYVTVRTERCSIPVVGGALVSAHYWKIPESIHHRFEAKLPFRRELGRQGQGVVGADHFLRHPGRSVNFLSTQFGRFPSAIARSFG